MILVTHNKLPCTIQVGLLPFGIVTRPSRWFSVELFPFLLERQISFQSLYGFFVNRRKSVTFQVCFVHDPEPKLVAKIIEPRIVGLMTSPDSIDIAPLHQHQILL